jgi:hypothetical protein
MTGWLKLTNEQRKATIDQAEQLSGISENQKGCPDIYMILEIL